MKVILTNDADKLGKIGDVIDVKDGYARNYLIPNKLCVEATQGAIKAIEEKKKQMARNEKKMKAEYEKLADKIRNVSCTIAVETGSDDKLFGSVTNDMIASVLAEDGISVDKKKIVLDEPIKTLGVYNVDVKLHPEVKAALRVWVVKK